MNKFKIVYIACILFALFSFANADIKNERTGDISTTFKEAVDKGVNVGDTLTLLNDLSNNDFGASVTIPNNVLIRGTIDDPDQFPIIRTENQNYQLRIGDGVKFEKVRFRYYVGNNNGILDGKSGTPVFDKCVFEGAPRIWIRLSSKKLKMTNCIFMNSTAYPIQLWADGSSDIKIYNCTFYNISTNLLQDNNNNTTFPVKIRGCIFSNVTSVSNNTNINANVGQSVFYNTGTNNVPPATNIIGANPKFLGGNAPVKPTDFKLTQRSPGLNYLQWATGYPNDDIGSTDRSSRNGGLYNDVGAWEYLDYDPPEFVKINKFDVYYDSTDRPDYQHAKAEFNIEIAPGDWQKIMVNFNSYADTSNKSIAKFPHDSANGDNLFLFDRTELKDVNNDSITVIKNNNSGDTTWTIKTERPLNVPKAILDDPYSGGYIYGKGYYFSMFLMDNYGNWSNRNSVGDDGSLPLDKMQIASLASLSDDTSITKEGGETFSIDLKSRIDSLAGEITTDNSTTVRLSLDHGQLYQNNVAVDHIDVPLSSGQKTVSNISINAPGTYKMTLTTQDNVSYSDEININITAPPLLEFLDEYGNPIDNIDVDDGNLIRSLKVKLTQDGNPYAGTVLLSFKNNPKGRFGGTSTTKSVVFDGTTSTQDFSVTLPLNTNNTILGVLKNPNKPTVRDSIGTINGENMTLEFVDDYDVALPNTITTYNKLKNVQYKAILKTSNGVAIKDAPLKFIPTYASLTPSSDTTDANGAVYTTATIALNKLARIIVEDAINPASLSDDIFIDTRNVVIAFQENGDFSVKSGTNSDTLKNFSSLSFPITAKLTVNGNEIEGENFTFSKSSGTATFGSTTSGTTNLSGNVIAPTFSFTPGATVIGRFATRDAQSRDFVIKAGIESIKILSTNDTIKGEPVTTVDIPALYTVDGNPIPGIDINFSITTDNGEPGVFKTSNPVTTDATGKAIMKFQVPAGVEYNVVKAEKVGNVAINDNVIVYRVLNAPDKIEVLRWATASTGVDDTLKTTAGIAGKLLVKITSHGAAIGGKLTNISINDPSGHPNWQYSFDNSTWHSSGESINQAIPSSGFLTVYTKDTKVGVIEVIATESSAGAGSQYMKITPAGPDMAHSSFTATPTNPYVINVNKTPDKTSFLITIRDHYDNVIPNVNVNIPTSDIVGTVALQGPAYTATDINGQISVFSATNTKAETNTFTATLTTGQTIIEKPVVTFRAGPPTAIGSQPVVIYPDTATADGVDKITIEVHLRDNNGNPLVGKKLSDVGFIKIGTQKSATSYTLTPTLEISDANGLLRWELTDTKAQLDTIKINITGEYVPPVPIAVFIPGPASKVVIKDNISEVSSEITNVTIKAGDTLKTLYGVLYDKENNYIGAGSISNYSWGYVGDNSMVNKVIPTSNSINTNFIPTKTGNGRVWVSYNSLVDTTGTIRIIGGDASYVKVATENSQVETAGVPFGTKLTLYDKFDNVSSFSGAQTFNFSYDTVGVPNKWYAPTVPSTIDFNFTNGVSDGFTGAVTLKSADIKYYLIATAGAIETDTSSSIISLNPGAYKSLRILTSYNGFTQEFDTATIDFKTTIVMHASKFDAYENYIGDMNAKWLLGDGNLSPENSIIYNQFGDINGVFKFNPDDSSIVNNAYLGKIRAEDPAQSTIYDLTGNIKVISIPDHMNITSNSIGAIDSVYNNNTIRIIAGDSLSLYSATYDTNGLFMANFTSRWGYNFNIAGIDNDLVTNGVYNFSFTKVDTGIVFAQTLSNSLTGKRDDSTGTIIVLPGSPDAILVQVIGSKTVIAGDSVPVKLTLIDKYGNTVNTPEGDITINKVVFNITPSQITPAPHHKDIIYPEGPFVFEKGLDTTYLTFSKKTDLPTDQPIITAEVPGVYKPGNTDTVWVNAGIADHIKIMYGNNPISDTLEAGNMTLTIDDSVNLVAVLYDKMGNYLGIAQSNWDNQGFAKEKATANSASFILGPFFGLTNKGDVFATPVVSGIVGDTAFNFKVIAGLPVGYDIHVNEALGLPKANMGDTVAANQGFNIKIRLVDRLGNFVQKSTLDTQNLNFKWGATQKYPAGELNGNYVFVNGEVIITEHKYPWMIDHTGKDSLLVFNINNTFMQDWGKVYGIDRSGPSFSNDRMKIFDNNGDGYIDSIVVKFSEPIDTSKIKDGIEQAFELLPDSLRSDAVTKWLTIVKVKPIDNQNISLVVEVNPNAPASLIPKTDLEPKIRFLGNTMLPNGIGIYDLDGNSMGPDVAETVDKIGPVIVYAKFDDNCDNYTENDKLILTLSENVSYDTLLLHENPKNGILIFRKVSADSFAVKNLINGASYLLTPYGIGNEVVIQTGESFTFSIGRDYVKLQQNAGYRDTTIYKTDTPANNQIVKIKYVDGFCEHSLKLVPNPPFAPNRVPTTGTGAGSGAGAGAVFMISTDRPADFLIYMVNCQGNVVNKFKFRITQSMLDQYGQESGERLDFYFGVQGKDGYLTPIPLAQYEYGFDIHNINPNLRWMPVNSNGRYLAAGVYFLKYYTDNKYITIKTIIIK